MRVLFLSPAFQFLGGAEQYSRDFVQALCLLKHRVDVLSLHSYGDAWQSPITGDNAEALSRRVIYSYNGNKKQFGMAAHDNKRFYDLVIAGHPHLSTLAYTLHRPYYVLCYGIDAQGLKIHQQYAMNKAEDVICLSHWTASQLRTKSPGTVIHPHVDPVLMNKGTLSEGTTRHEPFTILTLARLDAREQYKGVDRVIRCLPDLVEYTGQPIRYLIAGSGSDLERLEGMASRATNNKEINIVFLGDAQRGSLHKLYHECDLFVMPSTGEGFGIVFIEAQAHGKPVIAGDNGSLEAVGYNTGFNIRSAHTSPMKQIATFMENESLRLSYGRNARRWVETRFSQAWFVREVESVVGSAR